MIPACVLVVDDNPDVLVVLRALLELKGFQVVTAEDGDIAWEFLKQIRPDVIVTDMRMPKVDGGELIRRVRSSPGFSGVPIVAISAYGRHDIAESGNEHRSREPSEPRIPAENSNCVLEELAGRDSWGLRFRGGHVDTTESPCTQRAEDSPNSKGETVA